MGTAVGIGEEGEGREGVKGYSQPKGRYIYQVGLAAWNLCPNSRKY